MARTFSRGKPAKRHVLANLRADGRKSLGELDHMFVFGALAHLAKKRMVAILLAPLGIAAGGLDVTVRKRADPDIGPGRGDGERLDPPEDVRLCQPGAIRPRVGEAFPDFLRRIPGRASETYLRPADSAASFGSTIVCTSAADSNKALTSPCKNFMNERQFHKFPWPDHAREARPRSLKYRMPMSRARLTAFAIMMTKSFFKTP